MSLLLLAGRIIPILVIMQISSNHRYRWIDGWVVAIQTDGRLADNAINSHNKCVKGIQGLFYLHVPNMCGRMDGIPTEGRA